MVTKIKQTKNVEESKFNANECSISKLKDAL
jgi:hypothetical protein